MNSDQLWQQSFHVWHFLTKNGPSSGTSRITYDSKWRTICFWVPAAVTLSIWSFRAQTSICCTKELYNPGFGLLSLHHLSLRFVSLLKKVILRYEINNEIYKEKIQQIIQNRKFIAVPGVCCSSMLHVYRDASVSCSISILFVYVYARMPSIPRSVAGVPSSRALPGFPITAHRVCAFLI